MKQDFSEFFRDAFLPGLKDLAAFAMLIVPVALTIIFLVIRWQKSRRVFWTLGRVASFQFIYPAMLGIYWLLLSFTKRFGLTPMLFAAFITAALWLLILLVGGRSEPWQIRLWAVATVCTCLNGLLQGDGFLTTMLQLVAVQRDLVSWSGPFAENVGVLVMITWGMLCVLSIVLAIRSYRDIVIKKL